MLHPRGRFVAALGRDANREVPMEWSSWLDMEAPISLVEVVIRMTLASVLGALIGWDREAQNKAAGVRTHMLVSLGAAVFILATIEMMQLTSAEGHAGADPTPRSAPLARRLLNSLVNLRRR
jgi:hypothetical protein